MSDAPLPCIKSMPIQDNKGGRGFRAGIISHRQQSRVLDYLDVRLQPLSYGMSNWNTEFKHNVIMCQILFSFKPLCAVGCHV